MIDTRSWRDRVARSILLLAALGALISFLASLPEIVTGFSNAQVVDIWRLYGFVVFTGLFGLLAFRPRHYPGLWELTIGHKIAVALTAALLIGSPDASAGAVALIDGVLAGMLVLAYLVAQGYRAWAQAR